MRDDDLPGALIPRSTSTICDGSRPTSCRRVFEHNRHDILSLAALAGWVADAVAQAPRIPISARRSWPGSGGSGRRPSPSEARPATGRPSTRASLARRGSGSSAAGVAGEALAHAGRPRVRCGKPLPAARAIFDARPWEEMAKIHEHRLRDFVAARAVVTEALERARAHRAPALVLDALASPSGAARPSPRQDALASPPSA